MEELVLAFSSLEQDGAVSQAFISWLLQTQDPADPADTPLTSHLQLQNVLSTFPKPSAARATILDFVRSRVQHVRHSILAPHAPTHEHAKLESRPQEVEYTHAHTRTHTQTHTYTHIHVRFQSGARSAALPPSLANLLLTLNVHDRLRHPLPSSSSSKSKMRLLARPLMLLHLPS